MTDDGFFTRNLLITIPSLRHLRAHSALVPIAPMIWFRRP